MRNLDDGAGHAMAEYAVIIAGIATVCVVAALFLAATVRDRVDRSSPPNPMAPQQTFTPPAAPAEPTSLDECERGGWRNFPQFRTERECRDYVLSLGS